MSTTTALAVTIFLLLANAFFVGSEFAVMSARRAQVEPLLAAKRRGAVSAMWAIEHVTVMLATAQLGVTLCSTGLGAVAEPAIAHLIHNPLVSLGLPSSTSHIFGFAGALTIVIFAHVVFGEMVPKNLSVALPDKAILLLAPPLVWVERLLGPIVRGLDHFANWMLGLFGIESRGEVAATFTLEEVASIVEVSQAEGLLDDEAGLLSGTLEFSEEIARTAMVSVDKIVALPEDTTPAQVERASARTGFSRFLIQDEQKQLVGYIHIKDVLYASEKSSDEARERPIDAWRIRSLASVSPEVEIEDVLQQMQRSATHVAIVTEANQQIGVIFLEDIIEALVGEVRDTMQRTEQ
ncbi:hemolysin family protein [Boudabousia marimammalium]|uniref:CNNM transmembrane domain-containing protein n=1 Tax=Boudabousia marimammalium TaxID=156892 RepID=A0A1Q5PRE4_9ACTO|nr:hemolysin family protein [Boudabousia marimammalium]OKL50181.1 hypothetical protein BM477_01950 [Boudabousia marimammalium]